MNAWFKSLNLGEELLPVLRIWRLRFVAVEPLTARRGRVPEEGLAADGW